MGREICEVDSRTIMHAMNATRIRNRYTEQRDVKQDKASYGRMEIVNLNLYGTFLCKDIVYTFVILCI